MSAQKNITISEDGEEFDFLVDLSTKEVILVLKRTTLDDHYSVSSMNKVSDKVQLILYRTLFKLSRAR